MEERPINWFPGHMAKARRLLSDQLKRIDLVIELCDARLPFSSRNPELIRMTNGKKRVLFLNKADLANPDITNAWLNHFRSEGENAYALNATMLRSKEMIGIIEELTREIREKSLERGIKKTVRAMVIGVPNVGKSTVINRIRGNTVVKTGDRPGVTRSSQWVRITPYLELLDTPGMLWPRLDDQKAAIRLCWIGSVKDEVTDIDMLTMSLLEEMKVRSPAALNDRFHVLDSTLEGINLLDAVCRGRGWLLKGNRFDYDRCYSVVLDEFRSGKLGRISLEWPDTKKEKTYDIPGKSRIGTDAF